MFLPERSISKLYTGCQLLKCKYLKQKLLHNVQHLPSRKMDRKWPKGKLEWKTDRKLQLHNLKSSVSYGKEHGVFNHEKMRFPSTVLPVTPHYGALTLVTNAPSSTVVKVNSSCCSGSRSICTIHLPGEKDTPAGLNHWSIPLEQPGLPGHKALAWPGLYKLIMS